MTTKKLLCAGMFVLLLVGLVPLAQAQESGPVARLLPPSGPYVVGRTAYHWIDDTRDEVHTPGDAEDKRELAVDVWYPAEPEPDAQVGPYLQSGLAEVFALMNNVEYDVFTAIYANAVPDAPLAGDQDVYPVVVFDPGFSETPREYTMMLEELASQGYVVFGVYHPYVSRLTTYPDGREISTLTADQLASLWAPEDRLDGEFRHVWVPDVLFVLDQIDALNADDPVFAGRLDTERMGLAGHSQGARTISEVCLLDARCVAAVNMDGSRSERVELAFDKPYIMMLSDNGVEAFVTPFEQGLEALASDYYVIMIPHSNHMSFVDTAFWAPFVYSSSEMDTRGLAIAQFTLFDYRLYMTAFFDKYVRDLDVPLLDGPSEEHLEVFFLKRDGPITLPTANAEAQDAVLGGNVGEILVGEADVWTYTGQAGEVLDLWLMADRPAGRTSREQRRELGLMDTLLVVRGPDGALLAANDDGHLTSDSMIEGLELPEDGVYQIEIRTWENQTGGGYSLIIESDREE